MLLLEKIISGGQTGADQAGLRAARRLGLKTGGLAPRGWRTLDGPAPWLAEYDLVEHPSSYYPPRTYANVRDSDATVRVAREFFSPGERCTLKAIGKFRKQFHDVRITEVGRLWRGDEVEVHEFIEFVTYNRVRVLNVAGNSDKTMPGIGAAVEEFLVRALVLSRYWALVEEFKAQKRRMERDGGMLVAKTEERIASLIELCRREMVAREE